MKADKAARLILKLEHAEAAMVRAVNKWQKLRAQVKRADAAMAKERQHVQGTLPRGGELHPGDLHPQGRAFIDDTLDSLR